MKASPRDPNVSADEDATFDQLVCRVSMQLEKGEVINLTELLKAHPKYAERFKKLMPTLQAMLDLRPAAAATSGSSAISIDSAIPGILGDFRILREIGRGGMGVVYEAEQISLARRVAVKILPFASVLDARRMQRFQNEARAAASLHHPHIVPVYFVGSERGVHFYAMQLIQGQSLDQVISELRKTREFGAAERGRKSNLPMPTTRTAIPPFTVADDLSFIRELPDGVGVETTSGTNHATVPMANGSTERSKTKIPSRQAMVELVRTAAEALEHAHQQGVIHRDIKPANLMLDVEGKVWVTDFGLAQIEASDTLTASGDLLGTLRYMSPEQAAGGMAIVDRRSDVYSLGLTLYELLVLEPAFPSRDRKQLLQDILTIDPRPLRQLDKNLPVELEIIVSKSIAKDPGDRYTSAAEFAADLSRFLQNVPILAQRPTTWQRARKWCQRHVEFVVAGAAFAVVFAVSAIMAGWVYWNQATELAVAVKDAHKSTIAAQSAQTAAETARDREIAARKLAVQGAAESKAVVDFLERQILAAARPEGVAGGRGINVTLREAIDQAVPFVEQSFVKQPLIELKLRRTLGNSYSELGEFASAAAQFQRAYEIAVQHLGPTQVSTLGDLANLGAAEHKIGKLDDAAAKLNQALELLQQHHPDHANLDKCLTFLAGLESTNGNDVAAVEKCEQVLSIRSERLGAQHSETLDAQTNLAMGYINVGRLVEAETLLHSVLTAQQEVMGGEGSARWTTLANLATVEARLGKLDLAVEKREQIVKHYTGLFGLDHISTLGAMVNLAMLREDQNRVSEAESLLQAAVPMLRSKYPEHDHSLNGLNAMATVMERSGNLPESMSLYEEALKLSSEIHGPDHVFTLGLRVNLANTWHRTGKPTESLRALNVYRQVLRILKKQYSQHPYTATTMRALAQVQMEVGQFPQSIPILNELRENLASRLPPDHPDRIEVVCRLAHCYCQTGDSDCARTLLEGVLPTLREKFSADELLAIALSDLATLAQRSSNFDEGVRYSAEAYECRVRELGPEDRTTLGELVNWGIAEWLRGAPALAAERLETALIEFRKGNQTEPYYGVCLKQLSAIYEELGREEKELEILNEFEQWLVRQGGESDPQMYRIRVRRAQRDGDWETAKKLVHAFELLMEEDPSDYLIAAGLRARLAEMAAQQTPADPAAIESQRKRIQTWLDRVEKTGHSIQSGSQFDPPWGCPINC
ncbi:MAG: tetratricopeptide repeat protein [Planctomycetaceae bacterium]|nr:tetratricopeptide repeat protein [Planctomycetaceae bacterium]